MKLDKKNAMIKCTYIWKLILAVLKKKMIYDVDNMMKAWMRIRKREEPAFRETNEGGKANKNTRRGCRN